MLLLIFVHVFPLLSNILQMSFLVKYFNSLSWTHHFVSVPRSLSCLDKIRVLLWFSRQTSENYCEWSSILLKGVLLSTGKGDRHAEWKGNTKVTVGKMSEEEWELRTPARDTVRRWVGRGAPHTPPPPRCHTQDLTFTARTASQIQLTKHEYFRTSRITRIKAAFHMHALFLLHLTDPFAKHKVFGFECLLRPREHGACACGRPAWDETLKIR